MLPSSFIMATRGKVSTVLGKAVSSPDLGHALEHQLYEIVSHDTECKAYRLGFRAMVRCFKDKGPMDNLPITKGQHVIMQLKRGAVPPSAIARAAVAEVQSFVPDTNSKPKTAHACEPVQPAAAPTSDGRTSPPPQQPARSKPTGSHPTQLPAGVASKTDSSPYYFFKSTPADQAAAYAPQRIVHPPASDAKEANSAHSKWNAAGTWEERDLTGWARQRLKEALRSVKSAGSIVVNADWEVVASASVAVVRSKKRYGFEFSASSTWQCDPTGAVGTVAFKGVDETTDLSNFSVSVSVTSQELPEGAANALTGVVRQAVEQTVASLRSQ